MIPYSDIEDGAELVIVRQSGDGHIFDVRPFFFVFSFLSQESPPAQVELFHTIQFLGIEELACSGPYWLAWF